MLMLLDKLIFGVGLLFFLQIPKFVETDYTQWLAGYYKSTQDQVQTWETIAHQYEFTSLDEMLAVHLKNPDHSVRAIAQEQQNTEHLLEILQQGMKIFREGTLLDKLKWILQHPSLKNDRNDKKTTDSVKPESLLDLTPWDSFKPGLPLDLTSLLFGVGGGYAASLLLIGPFRLLTRRRNY